MQTWKVYLFLVVLTVPLGFMFSRVINSAFKGTPRAAVKFSNATMSKMKLQVQYCGG
jgi:hypothetical protein